MKFTTSLFTPASLAMMISIAALTAPAHAANEALLDLLKILQQKGTLNADEYELLVNAAKADTEKTEWSKQEIKREVTTKVAAIETKTDKMGWAEKVKLKGDLRTRYQYQDQDRSRERTRGRLRYRLGVEAKPIDNWEVGAGLASGGSDQRSTNESFDSSFSTKDIRLDYAYMQYNFQNGFKGIAGKFPRKAYLWAPTDVMLDSDINPEGLSINYTGINAVGGFFGNTGVWVLEENSRGSNDAYMVLGQLGQTWKHNRWFGTVAGTVYRFSNTHALTDISAFAGTNTDSAFGSYNLAAEIGTNIAGGKARIIGEFIDNYETGTSADNAWIAGAKYGYHKWGFKYLYADVDANAVPDFLPDSDRFGGTTGIKGHEVELTYKLFNNVKLGLDYYSVERKFDKVDQQVVQADLNVKF